ncbi:hypothetical protein [Planococcus sp. ISL-110]|uniref:hypothetical protein n=1 Tax=Planococcus sp. ISL-110 TaxID=2819167 RepID=UPI001BE583B1|nr:hypothetical protein [Planococcus sp. ISL-110]MBT2569685.1 hypothetical protein [Planococcus sp. ISL-110]
MIRNDDDQTKAWRIIAAQQAALGIRKWWQLEFIISLTHIVVWMGRRIMVEAIGSLVDPNMQKYESEGACGI